MTRQWKFNYASPAQVHFLALSPGQCREGGKGGYVWGVFQRNNEKMSGNLSLRTPKLINIRHRADLNVVRHVPLNGPSLTRPQRPEQPGNCYICSRCLLPCRFWHAYLYLDSHCSTVFARYKNQCKTKITLEGEMKLSNVLNRFKISFKNTIHKYKTQ